MTTTDPGDHPRANSASRYGLALAAILAVFVLGRVAGGYIDEASELLLLATAVTASAWFAGTGPALLAVVAGTFVAAFSSNHDPARPDASLHLALFVVQGLLLTGLVAELRAARRAAESVARVEQDARRQGEAANRLKDEFLATLSHELRTPLNAILGWVHLLRSGKLDSGTAERGFEAVERNIRLQAQLTGDLLDVSKALTGRLQIECRPTNLNSAAEHAARAATPAARARAVSVEIDLPEEPLVILGDENRLKQIIWHLLANALKFTPRGGTVEVSGGRSGSEAWIRIQDSGPGIDPAFLPRIFERFTQADSSPTRTAGGLGVGLALVRELVELHGGAIAAENRAEGSGAIFTVRFPLQPASLLDRATHQRVVASVSGPPLDGIRVLVVDRSTDDRDLAEAILRHQGAMVRSVSTVEEALESLEEWQPDVLVSDAASPDHDSYTLVGKVQALDRDRGGRIPALALTSMRRDDRWARLLSDVQCDLRKPVEPGLLAGEVARLTGRERRRVRRQG